MAEIFLRLGCALVGWMLVYAHGILLASARMADCSPELWRVTFLFAGVGAVGALLLPAALAWRHTLRWVALPAFPLLALGALTCARLLDAVGGASLCDLLAGAAEPGAGAPWQRAWVPVQLAVLGLAATQAARYWRPLPTPSGPAEDLAQ